MKVLLLLPLFLIVSIIFAQNSPTESQTEKEKLKKEQEKQVIKMLDDAVGNAFTLKLPLNRATVYAIAGDLYWKFDEKHAKQLFKDMAEDIIISQQEADKEKKELDDTFMFFESDFETLRGSLLPYVAKHDAELALELLVQTRPAKLTDLLAKYLQPNKKQENGMFEFDPNQWEVRQEIALEQKFAILAAEENPDKAIKLMRESLNKGLSFSFTTILDKINKKNTDKAKSFADEIVKKIEDMDLTKNRQDMGIIFRILQRETKPESSATNNSKLKPYKFTESQIKSLAEKIFLTYMSPASNNIEMAMGFSLIKPMMEKLLPEKAQLIKQKAIELNKLVPPEMQKMQQLEKVWSPNSTAEEILEMIPNLNEMQKNMAYEALGNKIASIEDDAKAKKLIEQIPDEKNRERANEKYESAKINRAANAGKLDEAKKLIENLSKKNNQIKKLVALAIEFNKKKTEKDQETATNLMKDVKALINETPEDEDELNNLMEAVKGYAVIDSKEAFRLFEPIIDQINEVVQASAILSKYNKRDNNFKKGELIFKGEKDFGDGEMLIFRFIEQMQMLGKADFYRMNQFSDKFIRNDSRTIVKLFVAQGFLKEEKPGDEKQFSDEESYFEFY